jgi:phosphoribosylformimino-5-aminoimidazole carboxamide ribotide isomerase
MLLEMHIIPAVDIMNGCVVRLFKGNPAEKLIYANDPIEIAKKWEGEGADSLHVVDLDAALRTGITNTGIVSKLIQEVNIPVEVAGGIRSLSAVTEMLNRNAAKVVLGTLAHKDPETVKQLAKRNPNKIVISLDHIDGNVMVDGWRMSSGSTVIDSLVLFMNMGISEFLLTSVDRDGTMSGPDISILSTATNFTGAKIIASGGVSSIVDAIKIRNIGCSAVILGKSIYEGMLSVARVKSVL